MKGKMKLKNNSKRIIRKSFFYLVIIYSIFSITFYYSLKNSTKINNTKFINFLLGGGNSHLLEDYKLVNIINTSTDFLFNIDLKNPSSILDQGVLMYGNNEKVLEVSHNDDYSNLEELKKTAKIMPMVNQVEIHPFSTKNNIINYCKDNNIKVVAWSPISRGRVLSNDLMIDLSQKYKKSIVQIVLRWHMQKGVIPIPKSSNENRIKENIDIFDFEISSDDINIINSFKVQYENIRKYKYK